VLVVVVVLLVVLGIMLLSWAHYVVTVVDTALPSMADFKEITAVLFVLFVNSDI
jgi:hypothetical protein